MTPVDTCPAHLHIPAGFLMLPVAPAGVEGVKLGFLPGRPPSWRVSGAGRGKEAQAYQLKYLASYQPLNASI